MKKYLPYNLYTRILSLSLVLISLFPLSVKAQSTLCPSSGNNQFYEWVTRIKINDGTRTSGKTGYADFTSSSISTLTAGQTYDVEIDVRTNNTPWNEYVKLWLDLNQDNVIQDPQELIFVQNATVNPFLTFKGTVTIPPSAFNGSMIGRMIMQYAATPNLCGSYTYGTTYDVKVNILGGVTNPENKTLTVSSIGSGNGSITSLPEGINTASGINSFDFEENTNVTLIANPLPGSTFLDWSGAVSGTNTNVVVNLNSDKSISANFGLACTSPSFQNTNPLIQASTNFNDCQATVEYPLTISGTSPVVSYQFTGATNGTGSGTGSGQVFQQGITNVVVTANNICENVSTQFQVIVNDTIDPNTPTLADVIGQCDATATVPTTTDNCAGTINGTTSDPLTYATQGTHVITWSFDDGNENVITANQNVIVEDTIFPTITSPFDITTNVDSGICGAVVNYEKPTASDNCGTGTPPTTLTNHTFKGTLNGHTYFLSNVKATPEVAHANAIAAGGHLATISDAAENSFISGFISDYIWIGMTDRDTEGTWKWISNEPVTYTNWANGEPNNSGAGEDWAVINWGGVNNPSWNDWYFNEPAYYAIEFDGGTLPTTLVAGSASGALFPVGTTTVTHEAVDPSGNTVQTSFDVTVIDNIDPIALAKNVVIQLDSDGNGATTAALVDDGSNDACGIASLALSKTAFTCADIGTNPNTVTLTVTDNNGNISTIDATVTVEDNGAPIALAKNVVIQLDSDGNGSTTAALVDDGSNDACGVTLALSQLNFDCTHVGDNTVTLTVTDNNGNISTIDATVTVEDNVNPIALAQNVVVQLDSDGNGSTTAALVDDGSNDACGVTLALSQLNFDCTHVGDNTVTLTVTDTNMNVSTIDATVTVEDNIAPTAVAQDFTITLDEFGSAIITADDIDNGSSDNCTYAPSIDVTTFDCTNIGIDNTVTLTVTDAAGNTDATTANVTILEHFKETLDLRSLSSFGAFTGTGAITNAGTLTGDVGTNAGALTGFTGPSFNGNTYLNNAFTEQADINLMKVYIHLNNIFETHPGTHAPAFGNGETITPGVYSIGGAGSVAGTLTLDGQGDPNAVFIMKFKGAFTAGAATNIVLINSADAANVYWVAQGALSVGAASTIKGTLLAYPGAITLGVDSSIEGRLLSSVGAITIAAGGVATIPGGKKMNIPINPVISYTPAPAVDVLGSLENFSLFTSNGAVANASTSGILGDVGADIGAITGFATSVHLGSFYNADAVTAQAKIDLDNAYSQLMMIPTTVSSHTPAFGSGETLQAGVYATPGAGSLAGTITLDGENDPDAIFIFKFNGAFSAGAQSRVILSNGTHQSNVFWISEGATSIGSFSTIKGTVIANNGAATIGAGGNLEGRLLSTGGAIGFSTGVVYTVVHDVECGYEIEQKGSYMNAEVTSIESPEQVLLVYPNPSRGIFNIKLSTLNVQTDIYLFDIVGKLIERKSISKENNSGNLISIGNNDLPSGIYLARIMTNRGVETKKLVVDNR